MRSFILSWVSLGLLPFTTVASSNSIDSHSVLALDQDAKIIFQQDLDTLGFTNSYFQDGNQLLKQDVNFLKPYCQLNLYTHGADSETLPKHFKEGQTYSAQLTGITRFSYGLHFNYADGSFSFNCMTPSWGMLTKDALFKDFSPSIGQFKQIMDGIVNLEIKKVKPFQCTVRMKLKGGWSHDLTETGYTEADALKNVYDDCTENENDGLGDSFSAQSDCKEKLSKNQYQCVGI